MIGNLPTVPGALIGYLPKSGKPVYAQAGGEDEARSVEAREERIKAIDARLAELDAEYDNVPMPDEAREEWNTLNGERDQQANAVKELKARRDRMRQLVEQPGATERAGAAPAFVPNHGEDIYDLARIRTASRSEEEHAQRLRDNAMRAVERAKFAAVGGSQEKVQEHVARLLDSVDDRSGTLAQRILATGNPVYDRAFGKAVLRGLHTLTGDEQRAMAVGVGGDGTGGGLAVPFQLDPTIILASDGSISPLRQISRVEQITSKTWQGITSQGITVTRSQENAAAGGNEFTIAQPEVSPTRVIADVQFSVEIDQDWPQLRSEIARLLADAKQTEEDESFVTGSGTGNNPFGVVTTLASSSEVPATGAAVSLDDIDTLEAELPPRFRGRASYLASKAIYQAIRGAARSESLTNDRWTNMTMGQPATLDGFPAYEASAMATDFATAASRYLLFGDFSQFLIVDRLGMTVELNPHVTNGSGRWMGQRSIVAVWRNSSKVLVDNAFRVLTAPTTP